MEKLVRVRLEENKDTSLDLLVIWDNEDSGYTEFRFRNPHTGNFEQELSQVFAGWSEQEDSENKLWQLLRERIVELEQADMNLYDMINYDSEETQIIEV